MGKYFVGWLLCVPAITTPSRANRREPRLPHERDTSSDPGAPVNVDTRKIAKQAAQDLARGLVDTGTGPVLERLDAEHFNKPANTPAGPRRTQPQKPQEPQKPRKAWC